MILKNASFSVSGLSGSREKKPAYSKRLCRKTLTSLRLDFIDRMSNAHCNSPSSITPTTSRVPLFKNIAAADNGTSGRRAVNPKSNGRGTGATSSFRRDLRPDFGLRVTNGMRNHLMAE